MVHGGLRYLQGDVRLVYEALRERQRLRHNAPHLVSVLPFMIPILGKPTKPGRSPTAWCRARSPWALGSAMWGYHATGGWRIGKLHRRLRAPAARAPAHHARRSRARRLPVLRCCRRRRVLAPSRGPHRRGTWRRSSGQPLCRGRRQPGFRRPGRRRGGRGRPAPVREPSARCCQRGRCVGQPTTCAPSTKVGTHTASAPRRACTWCAVAQGAQRHRPSPYPRTSAACSWCRGVRCPDGTFRHCYIGTTDTGLRGPARRSAVHGLTTWRTCSAALNASVHRAETVASPFMMPTAWSGRAGGCSAGEGGERVRGRGRMLGVHGPDLSCRHHIISATMGSSRSRAASSPRTGRWPYIVHQGCCACSAVRGDHDGPAGCVCSARRGPARGARHHRAAPPLAAHSAMPPPDRSARRRAARAGRAAGALDSPT